ncbi:MAG TPA: radical SAM protein [Candidatus Portnoybacteria bacterium]|nr:radical SAM protein [Candidatus Portnoybacteria bacterium]
MELGLSKKTYKKSFEALKRLKEGRAYIVPVGLFRFSEIEPETYKMLDLENSQREIWLKNFPYCAVNSNSRDHILFNEKYSGEKAARCKNCRYFLVCGGFPAGYFRSFGAADAQPVSDLPDEIMIEIESRCNLNCRFCFNKVSFASHGRQIKNRLTTEYVKNIIRHISRLGIKIVRFTGGEPLLRSDIFELMTFAKSKKMEVRLNTNGQMVNQIAASKMAGIVDNILIPIESWENWREDKITGASGSLARKKTALKLLAKAGIPVLRVGTVATKDNILNFNKLEKLISKLPIKEWEFYRPVPSPGRKEDLSPANIAYLTKKIVAVRKKSRVWVSLANAIPFCVLGEGSIINAIGAGALFDEGHRRLVVDPRGFLKPHYFIDKNIGDPLNIKKAWQSSFMKKIRLNKALPAQCQQCRFVNKCCGGSRYWAKITYGNWWARDPLMKK